MRNKLLFIGLDGASYDQVTGWAHRGELPNISAVLKAGAHGVLTSSLDVTPPAWSSIYTGKNPGKHGIFDFMFRKPGTYTFVPTNASRRDSKDVWELLSEGSHKVVVLNAPLTYPVRPVNGYLVSGFLTPGEEANYTYPQSLKNELREAVPGFRPSTANELKLNLSKDAYVEGLARELENLRKAALYLVGKDDWDFFAVIVSETDHSQHWFTSDMERGGKYAGVVLDTFKAADRIVGDLMHRMGSDANVMVASDHGSCALRRYFHTNYFLHSIGMLNFKRDFKTRVKQALYTKGATQKLYQFLIGRKVFLLHYLLIPLTLSMADVDWSRTSAFSAGYGQIYLNLVGRDPSGAVPGERARAVRDYVVKMLSEVSDPLKGGRPIAQVHTNEEIFNGPHASAGPDIQLVMSEGYEAFPWSTISDRTFTDGIDRSGTHNTRGIFAISGKGVSKVKLEGTSVADVAPTILGIMGVPIPEDMDGHFVSEAFTIDHLSANPVTFGQKASVKLPQVELTREEEEKIEESLRALGYI